MNDYDGLALPQLLDLMKDPVVAPPVPWWPQTIGWWIVIGWLAGILVILASGAHRRRLRNRYRHEALGELRALSSAPDGKTAGRIATLLKRVALAAYPRSRVAHLYGERWAAFLTETSDNDRVVKRHAHELASAAYRKDVDPTRLVAPARRWIRVHRA